MYAVDRISDFLPVAQRERGRYLPRGNRALSMADFFMHLSCQRKKFLSKQTPRVLDLGIDHSCGRAERQGCGKARHRGERPFPALPFRPRGRPELERDAAEDETEQREDREVERRHDDRECERKRREHGGAASVFELGEGFQ